MRKKFFPLLIDKRKFTVRRIILFIFFFYLSIGNFLKLEGKNSFDLVIFEKPSWQIFLSTIPAVTRINSLPPLLIWEEGKYKILKKYIDSLKPETVLIVGNEKKPPFSITKLFETKKITYIWGEYPDMVISLIKIFWKNPYRIFLVSEEDPVFALLSTSIASRYQSPILFFREKNFYWLSGGNCKLNPEEIIIVGKIDKEKEKNLKKIAKKLIHVRNYKSLLELYFSSLPRSYKINNLIVTNPKDISSSSLSLLSVPLSIIRHAPILPVEGNSEEIEKEIKSFQKEYGISLKYITLVGDETFLPFKEIPDPVYLNNSEGEENFSNNIKVELCCYPEEGETIPYAVGRITGENLAYGLILLANIIKYEEGKSSLSRNILVLGNSDASLDLCELITRATVKEFENFNIPLKSYFRNEINDDLLEKQLPGKDIIIFEGHLYDLMNIFDSEKFNFSPVFFFAQSCNSLNLDYFSKLIENGGIAYIGSNSYIHSASGAAFVKTFFDGILYKNMDIGSALMYAKNYLITWIKLKKKRGHKEWAKPYRVALSFTLFGDPTTTLNLKADSKPILEPIKITTLNSKILLSLPEIWFRKIETEKYYTSFPPGGKFAGVVKKKKNKDKKKVFPIIFASVPLESNPSEKISTTDVDEKEWTYLWDRNNKILYLIIYKENLKPNQTLTFTINKK